MVGDRLHMPLDGERQTKVAAKLRTPQTVLHTGTDYCDEEGLYCRKSREHIDESLLGHTNHHNIEGEGKARQEPGQGGLTA